MTEQTQAGAIPVWTIGDRLRKAREVTGLSQVEFAQAIDLSRQTITNYEQGHVKPRRIALRAWALRSGVPLEWLETGVATDQDGPDDGSAVSPPTRWYADSTPLRRAA